MSNHADTTQPGWNFENSYARLPEVFYARQQPAPVKHPELVLLNEPLAKALNLNPGELSREGVLVFAGNRIPPGAEPIAQAYAGHQFGYFTMLGDGRAVLLGEQITPNGERFDIQLKGSGQTPFSRRGDGRAALGPMLREYIISEAMHALSIPTTRSLAVVTTGEPVYRETVLAGAILTRVAASHIRVGTFQYASAIQQPEALQALADYTIQRHYPEVQEADQPYLAFLRAVIKRQAALVSQWMLVGFIHGVMNTDNMTLSGETIDYGPCAFMNHYDPMTVFSSIDAQGRYAYGNQPPIAQWNLARFAETLLPLLHPEKETAVSLATEAVTAFQDLFQHYWLSGMRAKLGLFSEDPADIPLIDDLLNWMHQAQADFTNTFRALSTGTTDAPIYQDEAFQNWHARWQARLLQQAQPLEEVRQWMRAHNPAVIPRNQRVEEALEAAVTNGDYSPLHQLLSVLAEPYSDLPSDSPYTSPPAPGGKVYQTFCGT